MFDVNSNDPIPLLIDFGSIAEQIFFWDYAKFERDLKTRLFLREALENKCIFGDIVELLKFMDFEWKEVADNKQLRGIPAYAEKAINCIAALRDGLIDSWGAYDFRRAYYDTLLFSTLTIIYRDDEDEQIPLDIQRQVACESAKFLLMRLLSDEADSKLPGSLNDDSRISMPSKPEITENKEIHASSSLVLTKSLMIKEDQKHKAGGSHMIYLPVSLRKKNQIIEIIPHQESVLLTKKMAFSDWKEKLLKMEAFMRSEDDIEVDDVGLAIGVQNFLYKDGTLYAGVRTKAKASEHKYQTGSVIATGSFNTGYELCKKNIPETGSLVQLNDPDYLQDLFRVIDRKRKHFVELNSPIHRIIAERCGVYQGNVKFRNGEFRVAVIFINKSIYYPRFEIGICKYMDILNYGSSIVEIIDSFGEDSFEDQNYWIWVSEGEIFYRSYKSEYYIQPKNGDNESCKKAILVTNRYFEQVSGKIDTSLLRPMNI